MTEDTIFRSLQEVWEWKDAVYEEIKDKTPAERQTYFQAGLAEAARVLGSRLERNSDGSYMLM